MADKQSIRVCFIAYRKAFIDPFCQKVYQHTSMYLIVMNKKRRPLSKTFTPFPETLLARTYGRLLRSESEIVRVCAGQEPSGNKIELGVGVLEIQ